MKKLLLILIIAFELFAQGTPTSVKYRIRMADSTYTAQLRGHGGRTSGLTIQGSYSTTFRAHEFSVLKEGYYDLWFDINGGSNYSKDASWSGTDGKFIQTGYLVESIDTDGDWKVDQLDDNSVTAATITDSVISLAKMTQAALNYIGSGGNVTNNPDDVTLENSTPTTLGVKDNSITSAKIAANAITPEKIAMDAVRDSISASINSLGTTTVLGSSNDNVIKAYDRLHFGGSTVSDRALFMSAGSFAAPYAFVPNTNTIINGYSENIRTTADDTLAGTILAKESKLFHYKKTNTGSFQQISNIGCYLHLQDSALASSFITAALDASLVNDNSQFKYISKYHLASIRGVNYIWNQAANMAVSAGILGIRCGKAGNGTLSQLYPDNNFAIASDGMLGVIGKGEENVDTLGAYISIRTDYTNSDEHEYKIAGNSTNGALEFKSNNDSTNFALLQGGGVLINKNPTGYIKGRGELIFGQLPDQSTNNYCLSFDGGDYASANVGGNYAGSDTRGTWSFWAKPTDFTTDYQAMFSFSDTTSSAIYLTAYTRTDSTVGFNINYSGVFNNSIETSDSTFYSGQWNHMIIECTGTEYKITVNGGPASLTVAGGANDGKWFSGYSRFSANTMWLSVGARVRSSGYDLHFNGLVDEIIYLSDSTTATINSELYGSGTPQDVSGASIFKHWWRFEEGTGTTTKTTDNSYTLNLGYGTAAPSWSTDDPGFQGTSDDPELKAGTAAIYAKANVDTTEMYVEDSQGNVTKISPHSGGDWVFYSKNVKTGKKVKINMEKFILRMEEITGEKFFEEYVEGKK